MQEELLWIEGINKPLLLAFFYQAAVPRGSGFLHYRPGHDLSVTEAQGYIDVHGHVETIHGRSLHLNFRDVAAIEESACWLDTSGFAKANGAGVAAKILDLYLDHVQGQPYPGELAKIHQEGLVASALVADQEYLEGIETERTDLMTMVNAFNDRWKVTHIVKQYLPKT